MRDIDERLTEGLRELVDRAPVEAEVWDDTARYVRKHKQRRQAAIAGGVATIVAAIGITAAVRSDGGKHADKGPLRIEQPGKDPLPEGTSLLGVHGSRIVALASDGHELGTVFDAGAAVQGLQVSGDHKTLWFSTSANCPSENYKTMRLDLTSEDQPKELFDASTFAVSPDGTRVAYARADNCEPLSGPGEQLYVRDLEGGTVTEIAPDGNPRAGIWRAGQIAWSPDGKDVAIELDDEDASSAIWTFHVPKNAAPSKGVEVRAGADQAGLAVAWADNGLVTGRWDATSGLDSDKYYVDYQGTRVATTTTPIANVFVVGGNVYVESFSADRKNVVYSVKSGQLVRLGEFNAIAGASAPGTLNVTTEAPTPSTTTTTVATVAREHDACPENCVGKARADVDGDGTLDDVGYMQLQAPTGNAFETRVLVRVIFSDGRVVEHADTGHFDPQWLGAADVFGSGGALIFYFNEIGAHSLSGHILRFDGTGITPVTSAGKPFVVTIDNYYLGDTSFTCDGGTLSVTTDQFDGDLDPNAADGAQPAGPWSGKTTKYSWFEGVLDKVGEEPVSFTTTASDQSARPSGAHCPGLPEGPSNLLRPHTSDPALDGF